MNEAIIAIGANINPHENIARAKTIISENHQLLAESRFVETTPIGHIPQPNYINGAILIRTEMSQVELRNWLKRLEDRLGRVRLEKYGPRTIDLDIVVWNGKIIDADVYERDFLRQALLEIYPNLKI